MGKKKKEPKNTYAAEVGGRLEQLQTNFGLSNSQMAEILGVTTESYRMYCVGDILIPSDRVHRLYEATSADIDFLMTGRNKERLSFTYLISTMSKDEIKRFIDEVLDYVRAKLFDILS